MQRIYEAMSAAPPDVRYPLRWAWLKVEGDLKVSGFFRYRTFGAFRTGKYRCPDKAVLKNFDSGVAG